MFHIDWNPVIFNLGTLEVRWYGIMVVLAVIAVIAVALVEAKRKGLSQDIIWDLALWCVIGGIVGARLIHIIDKWEYYSTHPDQLVNFAGLAIWGAVLGALAALIIYVYIKKISFWVLGDIIAPGAILGQAIGRIGCTINGCCYGLTCDLPIAVIYEHPLSYAPHGVPLYPTQIFHMLWNLAGFIILWLLRKRLKTQGALFLLWLIYFSVGDFGIHFFREGDKYLFNLQQAQVIDLLILVVAIPLLIMRFITAKKTVNIADVPHILTGNDRNPEG